MSLGRDVDALLLPAEEKLRAAGIASAKLEAELLLAHAMGISRTRLGIAREAPTKEQAQLFDDFIDQRSAQFPLQYLTGQVEFYSRQFGVISHVAIPKPSTEALVDQALNIPFSSACDVGCGSGIIAITLALERPSSRVVAVDDSVFAIAQTMASAMEHNAKVQIVQADLLTCFRGTFDLIVSNSPYIADDEWKLVDPEVRFEPRGALAGGRDGLDTIRRLIQQCPSRLSIGGWLLLEVGFRQASQVELLMKEAGFRETRIAKDLDGIDRVVGGRR